MERGKPDSEKAQGPRVKVTVNGPYLVSGGVPLAEQIICVDPNGEPHGWKEGRSYPAQDSYALCRCGHSANMPFCDGSHARIGFDGIETAGDMSYMDQALELDGPELRLTDAETLCVAARFCHRQGGAWALTRESTDQRARQTAIEEACECPSGRLVAWEIGGPAIEPEFEPSIGLMEDAQAGTSGPIWVRGGIPVESSDGTTYEVRNRVTLCRCGRSAQALLRRRPRGVLGVWHRGVSRLAAGAVTALAVRGSET
jgi:CDGSH-type Zn-finger protein